MTLTDHEPIADPASPSPSAAGEPNELPPDTPGAAVAGMSPHRFRAALTGVLALAAGIQAIVLAEIGRHAPSAGARFDAAQARALASGAWFIDPTIAPLGSHHLVPTVANAPLTPLVLVTADLSDLTAAASHRLVFSVIFVVAVGLVGIALRDLAGPRAGVAAALLVAVFPPLWVSPVTLGSDTLVVATVSLVLFATARFWIRPGTSGGALLGLAVALAALARADLVLLVVGVGIPVVLVSRGLTATARLRSLGALLAVFVLVLSPWAARGIGLFSASEAFDAPLAPVVAGANCAPAYGGPLLGWWSAACVRGPGRTLASERAAISANRAAANDYASGHTGSAVGAAAARVGRALDLFRPFQTARLAAASGRPVGISQVGVVSTWLLAVLAAIGAVVARRRRVLLFPFLSLIALSLLVALLSYGDPRVMVPADLAAAALGGLALDAGLNRLRRRDRPTVAVSTP
jgi:hypothetical protein